MSVPRTEKRFLFAHVSASSTSRRCPDSAAEDDDVIVPARWTPDAERRDILRTILARMV